MLDFVIDRDDIDAKLYKRVMVDEVTFKDFDKEEQFAKQEAYIAIQKYGKAADFSLFTYKLRALYITRSFIDKYGGFWLVAMGKMNKNHSKNIHVAHATPLKNIEFEIFEDYKKEYVHSVKITLLAKGDHFAFDKKEFAEQDDLLESHANEASSPSSSIPINRRIKLLRPSTAFSPLRNKKLSFPTTSAVNPNLALASSSSSSSSTSPTSSSSSSNEPKFLRDLSEIKEEKFKRLRFNVSKEDEETYSQLCLRVLQGTIRGTSDKIVINFCYLIACRAIDDKKTEFAGYPNYALYYMKNIVTDGGEWICSVSQIRKRSKTPKAHCAKAPSHRVDFDISFICKNLNSTSSYYFYICHLKEDSE